MRLSIGMIVKNEEQYLERCLSALDKLRKNVECELIIVDTGSTDATVEIARRFTDKVYFFEWCGDFAAARNETLKYATGEWYMALDADEIFIDTDEIERFMKCDERKKWVTASFIIENYADEKKSNMTAFDAVRLARRTDDLHYEGAIHEQFRSESQGMTDYIPNCFRLLSRAEHYGYTNDKEKKAQKNARNREILYSEFEKRKDEAFYYTQLYDLEQGTNNHDKAKEYAKRCIELSDEEGDEVTNSIGYMLLCESLYLRGEWEEIIAAAREYFNKKHNFRHLCDMSVYMYRGTAKFKLKDWRGAISDFKEYFKLRKKNKGKTGPEVYMHPIKGFSDEIYVLRLLECAVSYEQLKDYAGLSKHLKSEDARLFDSDSVWDAKLTRDYVTHAVLLAVEGGDRSAVDYIAKNGSQRQLELMSEVIKETTGKNQPDTPKPQSEFEMYAAQVKNTIRQLINSGKCGEARALAEQYRQLCPNDAELAQLEKMILSDSAPINAEDGIKLSIGMIVKNEEQYLERCLSALDSLRKNVASELIIVDTGSTDATVEIAKRFTDKVYFFEWCDDFAAARNEVLGHATGEWFMGLDADEIFKDTDELESFLNSAEQKQYDCAVFNIANCVDNNPDNVIDFYAFRLVRRTDDLHYEGRIHEAFVSDKINKRGGFANPRVIQSTALHYGYNYGDEKVAKEKGERNRKLLLAQYNKNKNSPVYLMQLFDLEMNAKNHDAAINYIKRCIDIVKKDENMTAVAYMLYADAVYEKKDYLLLKKICGEYFALGATFEHMSDLAMYLYDASWRYSEGAYADAATKLEMFFEARERMLTTNYTTYEQILHPIYGMKKSNYLFASLLCSDAYRMNGDYARAAAALSRIAPRDVDADSAWYDTLGENYIERAVLLAVEGGDKSAVIAIAGNGSDKMKARLHEVISSVSQTAAQNEPQNPQSEFEMYAAQIKATIRQLINSGKCGEARALAEQYRQLCPNDAELAQLEEMMKK